MVKPKVKGEGNGHGLGQPVVNRGHRGVSTQTAAVGVGRTGVLSLCLAPGLA